MIRVGRFSLTSIVIAVSTLSLLAVLGAWLTDTGPWYRELRKPWFQPPDFLFAPAWTTIFVCIGCAGVLAWHAPLASARDRTLLLIAFGTNFGLNSVWSWLFFSKRRPDVALVEVVLFWLSIVAMVVVVRPLSTAAVWLLMPYLGWVTFASLLNQRIVALNAPFSKS